MKWFLVALYVVGGGGFLVFALALISVVPDTEGEFVYFMLEFGKVYTVGTQCIS